MAQGSTLPPQAYTRETLTTAFNWLQTQPDAVRKMATTPDSLVCLYARAQRTGSLSLDADAPVSSQVFMSDLKNLAEGLRQFETPPERPQERFQERTTRPTPPPPQATMAAPSLQATMSAAMHAPAAPFVATTTGLNERSQAMIQEVKNAMNLSSETEATNLMIALAYKSLKSLLA